jgi:CRISPR-associated protein Csb3
MTDLIMRTCEPRTLLSHLAAYGLAAILEAQGSAGVRLGWTEGSNPRPFVAVPGEDDAAELIARHARAAGSEGSWVNRDITLKEASLGLMSPRLTPFRDARTWTQVQQSRQVVLDALTANGAWLDLRMVAALGEPCYWRYNRQGAPLQDDGASRLEMQPRNRGSEFVGTRLRKVAEAVAARGVAQILAGLRGDAVRDEIGKDKPDSRTATGLAIPGPTDNALEWCALWGISQFPLAMRTRGTAVTSGHFGRSRSEWFYVPMWHQRWRPAGLRSILAGAPLQVLAATGQGRHSDAETEAARSWLSARGVMGAIRFPVARFGSDSAPERRALRGEPLATGAPA